MVAKAEKPALLRVLVFAEGGHLIAQCLEYDIVAQGRNMEELRERFYLTFRGEVQLSKQQGRTALEGLKPAPAHYHEIWQQASANTLEAHLKLRRDESEELPEEAVFALP